VRALAARIAALEARRPRLADLTDAQVARRLLVLMRELQEVDPEGWPQIVADSADRLGYPKHDGTAATWAMIRTDLEAGAQTDGRIVSRFESGG
jgi:hypothetical protein